MGLAVRLTGGVAIALVLALLFAGRAGAVMPGRNGLLLISSARGTQFSTARAAVPQARVADCAPGSPDALWTVRPDGSHLGSVGPGSGGQFSPGGRSLLISEFPQCYGSLSLSLSFSPFRAERPIPSAAIPGGTGDAWPGPWLGPERPSAFDDSGRYLDPLTGRLLLPGNGYSVAGTPGVASCDGRVAAQGSSLFTSLSILTPVRSGRSVRAASRLIVADGYVNAQWSPDGRYLFYVLNRTHAHAGGLWRVGSNGAGRRLLYTNRSSSDLLTTGVSPDGRWVLLNVNAAGGSQTLWLIGSDGRHLHPLVAAAAGVTINSAIAEWSPRGDQVLVIEQRTPVGPSPYSLEPTSTIAFVIRPNGRSRHAVPLPPLSNSNSPVVWSPDERELAYIAGGSSVAITPVAGGPTRTILTATVPPSPSDGSLQSLSISDWQAVPGTGRPFKCLDGAPPF